jgi:hypothetical protein
MREAFKGRESRKPDGMQQSEILTLGELQEAGPESPINGVFSVDCSELASAYHKALTELHEENDRRVIAVYRFLHQLCRLHFKPSDRAEPFGPMMIMDGRRSAIPSDFRGEQNDVIAALAPAVSNPALRAKLADVAWLNDRRLAECGRLAVHSYVACIERLLNGEAKLRFEHDKPWDVAALEMLRRALVIADAMGRDKSEALLARDTVEKVREIAKARDDAGGYYQIARLALDFRTADAGDIGTDLEAFADKIRVSGDFPFAVDIYEEAERARHIARDVAGENRCAERTAECYVAWANSCNGSAMNEGHRLQQAIAKLRCPWNIKGTSERRKELQARLVTVQAHIRDEMGVFETEIDLTELVDHARAVVAGRSLVRAFAELPSWSGVPTRRISARRRGRAPNARLWRQ